jgi:hypothetical protein
MEEDNFDFLDDMQNRKREIDKSLLKQTLKRGNSMPLTVEEFIELFGEIQEDDFRDLSSQFISVINGIDDDEFTYIIGMENPSEYQKDEMKAWIVDGWGEDWVKQLLLYNQDKEEYEACTIIWDCLTQYSNLENFVSKSNIPNHE